MADDIVPALLERVKKSFRIRADDDRGLKAVIKKVNAGTATLADVHTYSERLGECLSKALKEVITPDVLPNGEMYMNIAQRVLTDTLRENHGSIQSLAVKVQAALDKADGLGIESLAADFPQERIDGLALKLSDASKPVEQRLTAWFGEPIVNNHEAFFDDFVRVNAESRTKMGIKTTIERFAEPGACEWCQKLAGKYDYFDLPDDIYRRHEACRCMTIFKSGRVRQDVWSKIKWSTPEQLAERKGVNALR